MNDTASVITINTLIVLFSSIFISIYQNKNGYCLRTFSYYFIILFASIIPSTFLYEIICPNKTHIHLEISFVFSIIFSLSFCLVQKIKRIMDFPMEFFPTVKIRYLLPYSVFFGILISFIISTIIIVFHYIFYTGEYNNYFLCEVSKMKIIKFVFSFFIVPLIGIPAFFARKSYGAIYGLIEIIFSIIYFSLFSLASSVEDYYILKFTSYIFASIYIFVRGLDNMDKWTEKNKKHKFSKKWQYLLGIINNLERDRKSPHLIAP